MKQHGPLLTRRDLQKAPLVLLPCIYACRAMFFCAVRAGQAITVTCSRPSTGWIPFTLNLTAASAPNSCGASGSTVLSTAFTAPQNPVLARTSPATSAFCSANPNVTLAYTLSGSVVGAQFNLVPTTTNTSVVCSATPSNTSESLLGGQPLDVTRTVHSPISMWSHVHCTDSY
jgi:hypothetical protein